MERLLFKSQIFGHSQKEEINRNKYSTVWVSTDILIRFIGDEPEMIIIGRSPVTRPKFKTPPKKQKKLESFPGVLPCT